MSSTAALDHVSQGGDDINCLEIDLFYYEYIAVENQKIMWGIEK